MDNCKACVRPFQSGVKLTKNYEPPQVDATLYHQLFSILIYFTHSLLDISFVVSVVSRFMQELRESHWKVAKRIVCYLKGAIQFGIKYSLCPKLLFGYMDSGWASDTNDQKSTSGFVFLFSSRPLAWSSKKRRLSLYQLLKLSIMVLLMQVHDVVWI